MARKSKKSKKNKIDINIAVVFMILISILLAILIYTKSGYIGEHLSPILGGIMGGIKYIVPIGMFLIAIYMTYEDRDYLFSKLLQYGIFLLCIATVLSVVQVSNGNINIKNDFSQIVKDGYYLGEKNIGGGAIGAIVAGMLVKLLGELGTVILCIGFSIMLLVFLFGIQPAEMINEWVESARERREERKSDRRSERNERNKRRVEEFEEDEEEIKPPKETKKQRKLREKEEARRQAEELADQITINLNGEPLEEDKKERKLKKYNHDKDDLIPNISNKKKEQEEQPDFIEANLFKTEQETKEEKVKEVLQLEHTLTVEDEHYEIPPIQL